MNILMSAVVNCIETFPIDYMHLLYNMHWFITYHTIKTLVKASLSDPIFRYCDLCLNKLCIARLQSSQ